jgi:D-alanine-D-alanine ligase
MKALFIAAGIPIVKHVTILRSAWEKDPKNIEKAVGKLKYPVFVKPANLGSSVGISKAHDRKELGPAIAEAAKFDRKIVIEEGVGGRKHKAREIEVSVLGNDKPAASVPGEIVPGKEFYDYTAKYLDEGSQLIIPAKLSKAESKKIQQLAISAFKASRAFSRSPKFSAKASCCSSVMSWLRNSSTAYLSMPASMSAASCGVRGLRKSTPETSPKKCG